MKNNQESSFFFSEVTYYSTFDIRSQTCFIKLTLNNISIFLLIDHQTILASENKKKSISHSYLDILKTLLKMIV